MPSSDVEAMIALLRDNWSAPPTPTFVDFQSDDGRVVSYGQLETADRVVVRLTERHRASHRPKGIWQS